jgi:hypothetical protein
MDELPEPLAELIRDHRFIEATVSDARDAISAGAAGSLAPAEALAAVRAFEQFMLSDLDLHIAKEEQVLFPALLGLGEDTDETVEDMLVQHDSVRERKAALRQTLETLDAAHLKIDGERAALAEQLNGEPLQQTLVELREIVRRLDSILQGHFFDEEDGLFEPAATLLPPATLAELAKDIAGLSRP